MLPRAQSSDRWLVLVLALVALLRFVPIWFGLPYEYSRPDEEVAIGHAMNVLAALITLIFIVAEWIKAFRFIFERCGNPTFEFRLLFKPVLGLLDGVARSDDTRQVRRVRGVVFISPFKNDRVLPVPLCPSRVSGDDNDSSFGRILEDAVPSFLSNDAACRTPSTWRSTWRRGSPTTPTPRPVRLL